MLLLPAVHVGDRSENFQSTLSSFETGCLTLPLHSRASGGPMRRRARHRGEYRRCLSVLQQNAAPTEAPERCSVLCQLCSIQDRQRSMASCQGRSHQ